ncbi:hypothetical protein Z042_13095 [Chania multitudinisentens RB-25]|uniref:Acetyltransferase n=1 Tax=Chania multitudinisentens RB-25 TaxID=1441930 RepID=W0LFZ7_9GAMM|nr:arylamine N-acetyltransferase [Chania multitudinisentens]AHG22788.1 hypothetical protein Z042_13095 [Chania multitudinisentens RB-25]
MKNISAAFYRRIGWDKAVQWDKDGINHLIASSLMSLPFDNLSIFDAPDTPLSQAYIVEKILTKGQGGLCYELNTLLHWVMKECGLAVSLITGTVYDDIEQRWFPFSDTHVLNIVELDERLWLVDIGFGLKSPRLMVPLDGESVSYGALEYQVVKEASYYQLTFRKRGAARWSIGYRFAVDYRHVTVEELEPSRRIITFEEASPFNKNPMSAIFTAAGTEIITPSGHTITRDGKKIRLRLTKTQFNKRLSERVRPVVI